MSALKVMRACRARAGCKRLAKSWRLLARAVLAAGLLGVFAGCATTRPEPAPASAVQADLGDDGQWAGRFALRVERVINPETQSLQQDNVQGGFSLQSLARVITLELISPLGQTIAIVRSAPDGASLSLGDGKQVRAANAQELLEGQLGWRLPIERLPLALTALKGDAAEADKARQIAQALGDSWSAQLSGLDAGRSRLQLQWEGMAHGVSKLVLTLIIEPQAGVSTSLRR